jgi:hypothetical protein
MEIFIKFVSIDKACKKIPNNKKLIFFKFLHNNATFWSGDFFYNEPFWDMSKNGGLQIFIKMYLKCSTYGPENLSNTENTKCTIFEQNRLIAYQTQEKAQKMCWFGKLWHFKRLVKIMLFAKSYGWIHDPPASMALPLGPKN